MLLGILFNNSIQWSIVRVKRRRLISHLLLRLTVDDYLGKLNPSVGFISSISVCTVSWPVQRCIIERTFVSSLCQIAVRAFCSLFYILPYRVNYKLIPLDKICNLGFIFNSNERRKICTKSEIYIIHEEL